MALILGIIALSVTAPLGAQAAGDALPHGGYDSTSDACLQCHDIHEAGGDYVLLRWPTVTGACGSCHYLYMGRYPRSSGGSYGAGTFSGAPHPGTEPAYDPGYSGREVESVLPTSNSLGSRTSAYETDIANRFQHNGHNLERGPGLSVYADGSHNAGNYIPGGSDLLTAIERTSYPRTVDSLSFRATDGLYCGSCHSPHGVFGQILSGGSLGTQGGKLLSSKPNHAGTAISIDSWARDGYQWCVSCHSRRVSGAVGADMRELHNHPSSACLACHSNSSSGPNSDFPHTGDNANLLALEPDALCLVCHKAGRFP